MSITLSADDDNVVLFDAWQGSIQLAQPIVEMVSRPGSWKYIPHITGVRSEVSNCTGVVITNSSTLSFETLSNTLNGMKGIPLTWTYDAYSLGSVYLLGYTHNIRQTDGGNNCLILINLSLMTESTQYSTGNETEIFGGN